VLTLATRKDARDLSNAFSCWLGKSVVLLVAVQQYCVPLPCTIVGESKTEVHICIQDAWEHSVRKELILAVEEMRVTADRGVNCPRQASGFATTFDSLTDPFADTDLCPKRIN
jgi:hypothetical protein